MILLHKIYDMKPEHLRKGSSFVPGHLLVGLKEFHLPLQTEYNEEGKG